MNNYFDEEIKRVERELLQLATASQKSASVTPTIAKTTSFNIPLSLAASGYSSYGETTYKIIPRSGSLLSVTLDRYYDDIIDNHVVPPTTRIVRVIFGKNTAGSYIARIYVNGNNSDTQTLKGGGSVNVPVKMTVRSTDDFSVEAL